MKECDEKKCEEFGKTCFAQMHGRKHFHHGASHGGGAVYGLGLIGAAVYFISSASSFWLGLLGILKAIIWPVFMVYEAFKFLIG